MPVRSQTNRGEGRTIGVQHPITGDFALQHDTRHELHHKPLPKRGGPHGKTVVGMTTPGARMTSPDVPHDLAIEFGHSHTQGDPEDGTTSTY